MTYMRQNCLPISSKYKSNINTWTFTKHYRWKVSIWWVSSFHPRLLWMLIQIQIVEKSSAVLGLPDTREKKIALNANHEEICRFSSEDDENYRHVSALLVDLAKTAMNSFEEQSMVESFNSFDSTLVDGLVEAHEPSFCKFKQEKVSDNLLMIPSQHWYHTCGMRPLLIASL